MPAGPSMPRALPSSSEYSPLSPSKRARVRSPCLASAVSAPGMVERQWVGELGLDGRTAAGPGGHSCSSSPFSLSG